jgi:hypothetical protein
VTTPKINGLAVTTAKLNDLAVTTGKINANAVTNAKLDVNAVAANVFASGVQPLGIVATVPLIRTVDTIFVTADAKLYRWNGTAYVKTVENDDIVSLEVDKLTAGTINAAITTTNILQLSTDGRIYTAGKTTAGNATAGIFLGWDTVGTSAYKLTIGDATRNLKWDGVNLFFSGNVETTGYIQATGLFFDIDATAAIHGRSSLASAIGILGRSGTGSGVDGRSTSGHGVTGNGATGVSGFGSSIGVSGQGATGGSFQANTAGGAAVSIPLGNIVIGTATTTGNSNLVIKEGVIGSRLDNQIQIYGHLSDDSDTTLGLVAEQGVVSGTGAFAGINQIKIYVNGTAYWLPLQAV